MDFVSCFILISILQVLIGARTKSWLQEDLRYVQEPYPADSVSKVQSTGKLSL